VTVNWDTGRSVDCAAGACASALGLWVGEHWMTILGGMLLLWRFAQAFVLEPLGKDPQPGWLLRLLRRRRGG